MRDQLGMLVSLVDTQTGDPIAMAVAPDAVSLEAETAVFPAVATVLSVRRHALTVSSGKETDGERFFIASQSLEDTSPREFAREVREHWSVENKNHWKRDALWREDRTRLRNAKAVCSLALLRRALLPLLRQPLPDRFSRSNDDVLSALKLLRQPLTISH